MNSLNSMEILKVRQLQNYMQNSQRSTIVLELSADTDDQVVVDIIRERKHPQEIEWENQKRIGPLKDKVLQVNKILGWKLEAHNLTEDEERALLESY